MTQSDMPTIAREGEYEFMVHTREKEIEPPHVHVFFGDEEVRINLDTGEFMDEPLAGKRAAIRKAYERHKVKIREAWDKIHRR